MLRRGGRRLLQLRRCGCCRVGRGLQLRGVLLPQQPFPLCDVVHLLVQHIELLHGVDGGLHLQAQRQAMLWRVCAAGHWRDETDGVHAHMENVNTPRACPSSNLCGRKRQSRLLSD